MNKKERKDKKVKKEKKETQDELYDKVKNSKYKQQNIPGWRPFPTPLFSTIVFICIGIILIILGILFFVLGSKIKEIIIRYDNHEKCVNQTECEISLIIEEDMDNPIMIYYQLEGFYQNHRTYVKSKSTTQLNGKFSSKEETRKSGDCDPVITNSEMGFKEGDLSITGKPLSMDETAVPCGLIAKSYFNDNYFNWTLNGEHFFPDESNIAWDSDKKLLFQNTKYLDYQWINMTNEHFIVWMRLAESNKFRKLWGRILNINFKKGQNLTVKIKNIYNVSSFDGKKSLILSTVNILGGKNNNLAIAYIILGFISIILGIIFIVGYKIKHKSFRKVIYNIK